VFQIVSLYTTKRGGVGVKKNTTFYEKKYHFLAKVYIHEDGNMAEEFENQLL